MASPLGEFIQDWLRNHRGMTQRQLADRSPYLAQADISRMVTGARPTIEKLRALAEAMDVPYNRLAILAGYAEEEATDGERDPRERILDDLMRAADTRPDLLATLVRLRDENDEETYERALAVIHRFLIGSLETVRDTFPQPEKAPTN